MIWGAVLILVALGAALAALPSLGYSTAWVYGPVGILGLVLMALVLLAVFQKI